MAFSSPAKCCLSFNAKPFVKSLYHAIAYYIRSRKRGGGVISLPRNTARSLKINKSSVTIMQRIFETNSSFHVKYRTTGKV